jgi:hypothetical protein
MNTLRRLFLCCCLLAVGAQAQDLTFAEWNSQLQEIFSRSAEGPDLTVVIDSALFPEEWDEQVRNAIEARPEACAQWRIVWIPRARNLEGEATVQRLKDILSFPENVRMALLPPLEELIQKSARRIFATSRIEDSVAGSLNSADFKIEVIQAPPRLLNEVVFLASLREEAVGPHYHSVLCAAAFKRADLARRRQVQRNFRWSRKF